MGTTVRLYLPRAHGESATVTAAGRHAATLPGGGESILLVDDNAALRRVTLRRLAELGYTVCEAEDGPTAIAIMRSGERFDLLFTDIGLPKGMSGYVLAEQARRQQPRLKVLFTTGYGNRRDEGGDHQQQEQLLRKPYRTEELAAKVRAALAANNE